MGAISKATQLFSGASALALTVAQPAGAATVEPSQSAQGQQFKFEIPSQPLDEALRAVTRIAGAEIIFDREAAARHVSQRLTGSFTIERALAKLVRGTPLTVGRSPAGVFTIQTPRASITNVRHVQTAQTPRPAPAPAAAPPTAPTSIAQEAPAEDIVVTGFRASLQTAQTIKRNSDDIVDSIVAEDIGKLPDATGAESLARVTGVQVDRTSGEAAGVRVRGLPDLTTTYNGREVFTAEGRQVALQDFPSNSIARFDVYKSSSANLVEAGIAGEIDVRSRKPFDIKGSRIAGGITGQHWRQSQRLGVDASLLISKRWDTGIGEIGILVEGSYTDNNFMDAFRNNSQSILNRTTDPVGRYPANVSIEVPTAVRYRPSASAALQWRPSKELEFYADFLFQGFRGNGYSRLLTVGTGTGAALSNVKYCDGSTTLICSMTATGGDPVTGNQAGQFSGTNTYHGGGGFIWSPGSFKVTGDVALTDSRFTSTTFLLNYRLNAIPTRIFNFNDPAGGGGGTVQIPDVNLTDPASYRMTGITDTGFSNHGRSVQGRLDMEVPVNLSFLDKIQAGVRYTTRDADSASYSVTANATNTSLFYPTLPLDYEVAHPGFGADTSNSIRSWLTPVRQSIIDNRDALRALVGRPAGRPARLPVYTANEKSYAAYLQGRYAFDLGTMPIDGQLGLRIVRTTNQIDGVLTPGGAAAPSRSNEYVDYLPNVSARLRVTPQLQARLAFTMTRTRPGFGSLNPTLTVGTPQPTCGSDCRAATQGNPDLQPIKSKNYDASLEYYFSSTGSATIGVFRRGVQGFINNVTRQIVDPEFGRLLITSPENGQQGRITGVEVGFRTLFDIAALPEWARNFGVLANYTYLDHASELSEAQAVTLPGMQPIANVSKHLANAALFYETKVFSARASYNYRSSFVTYGSVVDPALVPVPVTGQPTLPMTEQGRGTLDFSTSITPVENITLAFNIANALGNPARNRRQFNVQGDSYPWQVRYPETVYRLGVRFRF